MKTRMLLLALGLFLLPMVSGANGFDASYRAYVGDLNSDGRLDLYFKGQASAFAPIAVDDVTILVPVAARPSEFVLLQGAAGNFTIEANLSSQNRTAVGGWPLASTKLVLEDFNLDGATDVLVKRVASATGGGLDQFVFASTLKGAKAPTSVRSITDDVRRFFKAVYEHGLNPDSLVRGQYTVVGVDPPSKVWAGSFASINPSSQLINALLSVCPAQKICGLSREKPLDSCMRTVDIYDANGNYAGVASRNVCNDPLHMWAYSAGSVTLAQNQTYHQNAVSYIDAFGAVIGTTTISDYGQIVSSLSLLPTYLGSIPPIGSAGQQCSNAPSANRLEIPTGFAPLLIPVGYECVLAATVVYTAAVVLVAHVLEQDNDTIVYSKGKATTPRPITHDRENEILDRFVTDPFGSQCPPPQGNGSLRQAVRELDAIIAWRITDLNPGITRADRISYENHKIRIKRLQEKRAELAKRHRDICGVEP